MVVGESPEMVEKFENWFSLVGCGGQMLRGIGPGVGRFCSTRQAPVYGEKLVGLLSTVEPQAAAARDTHFCR